MSSARERQRQERERQDRQERAIFASLDIDPNAPFATPELDQALRQRAAQERNQVNMQNVLLNAKSNYANATGKPPGGGKKVKRVAEEVRKQRNLEDIEDKIHLSYEVAKKVDINKIDIDLNILIVCKSIICHLARLKTLNYFALIFVKN